MSAESNPIHRAAKHRPLLAMGLVAGLGLAGFLLSTRSGQPLAAKEPGGTKQAAAKDAPAKDATDKASADKAAAADASAARAKADRAAIEELRDLAERSYTETFGFYESGDALATEVYRWSMIWMRYELELADSDEKDSDEKKLAATQDHLERMVSLANAGLWRVYELEFYVVEAEWLVDRAVPNPAFAERIALRKKLQGQWDVVSMEEDGKPQTKPDIKSITLSGRRAIFEHRLGTAKAVIGADPTSEPGTIDILGLNDEFPFGGQGIYRLDGDKLTLCWTDGGERPKQFATKAGDKTTLCVLKRAH